MNVIICLLVVVISAFANCVGASVSLWKGGNVKQYCLLKKSICPSMSQLDLVVAVMLNTEEYFSTHMLGLSNYYHFSAMEKDEFVAAYLDETNRNDHSEMLVAALRALPTNNIPDNCVVAMTRLGLEKEYNCRYSASYQIVSSHIESVCTNSQLNISFALSKLSEKKNRIDDWPVRVDVPRIYGDEMGGCIVMLRGVGVFQVVDKDSLISASVTRFLSGDVEVGIVMSKPTMLNHIKAIELLCFIPGVGVYGVRLAL